MSERDVPRPRPETDDAERRRREPLEIRVAVHPRGKLLGEAHMPGKRPSQLFGAEMAEDHPELERTEPPPELDSGVHQIAHSALTLGSSQVLRNQRERRAHHIHSTTVERAQIEWCEQPLVRIDDDRVRALPAFEARAALRNHPRDPRVRPLHVTPKTFP